MVLSLASIAIGTAVIAVIEEATEIPDASAVYLVAVVIVGSVGGTVPALGTAIGAFLVYDLLFTEPRFSLAVSDTNELLNLVLVLIVAIAVGRLAALGRERQAEAEQRATEATSLFAVSRLLATADRTEAVAGEIVDRLARDGGFERVWIGLDGVGRDRILADTGSGPPPTPAILTTLHRNPGDEPARWVRAHDATGRGPARVQPTGDVLRVRLETGGTTYGSVWALAPGASPLPSATVTRLLSLAADQVALGLRRDALRNEATSAEVARRSDALKSALLDSVSHDLRTPLASIRATAGNLADPAVDSSPEATRQAAESIDTEVRRLDRLVRSVLDLSRIEGGALQPEIEAYDVRELIDHAVTRAKRSLGARPVSVRGDDRLVLVDAVLFDAILANLLDNVADHTPDDAPVEITVRAGDTGRVVLTVEDGGPGVPPDELALIFDKFQTSRRQADRARRGMGVGLSIVRGMVEALGGTVRAGPSELGGLAIEIDLPAAHDPPLETAGS
jgi:two-component system sensor histidine kinase KdpD